MNPVYFFRSVYLSILFLIFLNYSFANTYTAQIIDEDYGIELFDKYNVLIKGDSLRLDDKGLPCQGWVKDNYENGKVLHVGYYVDGLLRYYKNYYPSGVQERSFKYSGFKSGALKKFFPNGKIRSEYEFKNGAVSNETHFHQSGSLVFVEKYHSRSKHLVHRSSYYENGLVEFSLQLLNKKTKSYVFKRYYENGYLQEEGELVYKPLLADFQKTGIWNEYDINGSATRVAHF